MDPGSAPPAANAPASPVATAHYPWAALIARLFLTLPLVCPRCGADMRIRAFITQAAPVRRILNHIGKPADPPVDALPDWEAPAQPSPEYVFNQGAPW